MVNDDQSKATDTGTGSTGSASGSNQGGGGESSQKPSLHPSRDAKPRPNIVIKSNQGGNVKK